MKVKRIHRKKLNYYLKEFYKRFPTEKHTIFHYVKFFKARLKNDKDAWIGLVGETGIGKSYFAIMSMVLFGRPMDTEANISYLPTGSEITEKLSKLNFQTFLVDEAAREMRAVNWQSKAQQGVNTTAMTDRFLNNLVYLNMPNFKEFTKSMKMSNFQFRVICVFRTKNYLRIVVQRKSRNWRSEDPWGDNEALSKYTKSEKRYGELTNDRILKIERGLPQTVMDFIVPNISKILPDLVEDYETRKTESRKKAKEEDPKDQSNVYKLKYEVLLEKVTKLLTHNPLGIGQVKVTKSEMANALGVSDAMFRKSLGKGVGDVVVPKAIVRKKIVEGN